jgi:cytochrome c biogenesis factor
MEMTEFGRIVLIFAASLCTCAILADLLAGWRNNTRLSAIGRYATIGVFLCLTSAVIALLRLLLSDDFSVDYVASHSSQALPVFYKVSALWAGTGGALLLWLWLQVGFVSIVFFKNRPDALAFSSRGRSIANFASAFFLQALIHGHQPFAKLTVALADGMASSESLGHLATVLHSPILLVGYAALIIPFAWSFSFFKSDPNTHVKTMYLAVRRCSLFACVFFTGGIVLGFLGLYNEFDTVGQWISKSVFQLPVIPWFFAVGTFFYYCIYGSRASFGMLAATMSVLTYSLCVYGGLYCITCDDSIGGGRRFFVILLVHVWVIAAIMNLRRHFRKGKKIEGLDN